MIVAKNEDETRKIARELAHKLKSGGVLCLYGDLGTGKTFITKELAATLGIDHFSVKSPTYTYIRRYSLPETTFYHIDLYRLEKIDELLLQEVEELLENPQNIVVMEWADRMSEHLPSHRIDVNLSYLDPQSRQIEINEQN